MFFAVFPNYRVAYRYPEKHSLILLFRIVILILSEISENSKYCYNFNRQLYVLFISY